MLLIHAVNAEGHPLEIYIRDGKIAAVGQDLSALAGEGETVLDAGGLTVLPAFVDRALSTKRTSRPAAGRLRQAVTRS